MLTPEIIEKKIEMFQISLDPEWRRWLINRGRSFHLCKGYVRLIYDGKNTLLHRLIMHAPAGLDVDHINGITTDNRMCNLRLVTRAQNIANSRLAINNTSGIRGVVFETDKNRWTSTIWLNGTRIRRRFKSKTDAIAWRQLKEREVWGEHAPQALDIF